MSSILNKSEMPKNAYPCKRLFDVCLAALLLVFLFPLLLMLAIAVRLTSHGPALYFSVRVGLGNATFRMPKLRSMRTNTPQLPTHLLCDPHAYLTPIGSLLRQSSLDELPQIWSILRGDLSFVGPRPALFNQADLIQMRTECGVHCLTPGLTGWAQINGRDEISIPEKVAFDREYLERQSLLFDLKIMLLTLVRTLRQDGIAH